MSLPQTTWIISRLTLHCRCKNTWFVIETMLTLMCLSSAGGLKSAARPVPSTFDSDGHDSSLFSHKDVRHLGKKSMHVCVHISTWPGTHYRFRGLYTSRSASPDQLLMTYVWPRMKWRMMCSSQHNRNLAFPAEAARYMFLSTTLHCLPYCEYFASINPVRFYLRMLQL